MVRIERMDLQSHKSNLKTKNIISEKSICVFCDQIPHRKTQSFMFTLVCSERGNEITANSADVGERDPDHDDHQRTL